MKISRSSWRRLAAVFALCIPMTAFAQQVNINAADAATLAETIKGVGLRKAQAIVEYRDTYGPFRALEDLTAVQGIGERTLELNRDKLTTGGSDANRTATDAKGDLAKSGSIEAIKSH